MSTASEPYLSKTPKEDKAGASAEQLKRNPRMTQQQQQRKKKRHRKLCDVEGCTRTRRSKGSKCQRHARQAGIACVQCEVPDCNKNARSRTKKCAKHARLLDRDYRPPTCRLSGCGRYPRKLGRCTFHLRHQDDDEQQQHPATQEQSHCEQEQPPRPAEPRYEHPPPERREERPNLFEQGEEEPRYPSEAPAVVVGDETHQSLHEEQRYLTARDTKHDVGCNTKLTDKELISGGESIRPLTTEEREWVKHAIFDKSWRRNYEGRTLIAAGYADLDGLSVFVRSEDLKEVSRGDIISAEVIDMWMLMLAQRYQDCKFYRVHRAHELPSELPTYILGQRLFIPVVLQYTKPHPHFVLYYLEDEQLFFLNSSSSLDSEVIKCGRELSRRIKRSVSQGATRELKPIKMKCSPQSNSYDCGVLICLFAYYIASRIAPPVFSQRHRGDEHLIRDWYLYKILNFMNV